MTSFFDGWVHFIVWFRLVGAVIGFVTMLVFFLASGDDRFVPGAALVAISVLIVHDVRTIRKWRRDRLG